MAVITWIPLWRWLEMTDAERSAAAARSQITLDITQARRGDRSRMGLDGDEAQACHDTEREEMRMTPAEQDAWHHPTQVSRHGGRL